jgi:hypothetical protein
MSAAAAAAAAAAATYSATSDNRISCRLRSFLLFTQSPAQQGCHAQQPQMISHTLMSLSRSYILEGVRSFHIVHRGMCGERSLTFAQFLDSQ